jgi:hypothetical protein
MLDMIETALRTNGFLFQRIDGQKSLERRIRALDAFNNDPTCTIMLASIGSVAEGYDHAFIFTMNSHFVLTSPCNHLGSISRLPIMCTSLSLTGIICWKSKLLIECTEWDKREM